jgi:SAM-dependent methyltransferase
MAKKKQQGHLEETKYWGPSNNTVLSVHHLNKFEKRALDLGCGSLRNSKYLFNCGLIVDAMDKNSSVKKYAKFFENRPKGLFNLKIVDYTRSTFGKSKYDIVVAQNSLSFNEKKIVENVIVKIRKALRDKGMFAGNLYGLKDFRVGSRKMSFYSKREVKSLLETIGEIHMLVEDEGETKKGKHWHAYEFVVEKN